MCTASASVTPCGGTVTGTWTAQSSCLNVSGSVDVQALFGLTCTSGQVTGTLQVTGTWTANADGTFTDGTMTTGSEVLTLGPECKTLSAAQVTCDRIGSVIAGGYYDTVTCVDSTTGGCTCTGNVKQSGSIGIATTSPNTSGNFTTGSNAITITSDSSKYSYCVSGNQLTLTPQGTPTATGSIVLQSGSSSSGGTGGSGGTTSTGGSGGTTSTGGSGGTTSTGGSAGSGGTGTRTQGPCDIYAAANMPCGAAYSMVRALSSKYTGPLYQVRNGSSSMNTGSGGMTKDIGMTAAGFADTATQDTFCAGSTCTFSLLYDQSGNGNHLKVAPKGLSNGGDHADEDDFESSATKGMLMVGGHKVYSLYTKPSQAYWRDGSATGMPLGASPQGIYIVTSGKHFNGGCCYDYGNGEVSRTYVPGNSMDALYFGSDSAGWGTGDGAGPWVMADLEGGVFSGPSTAKNDKLLSQPYAYVTAMEKNNGMTELALKAADATAPTLNTYYQGKLPNGKAPGQKQGSIVLGSGGDCCYSNNNASLGTFYEGAIVAGYPSDATDAAVHANIVSAGYGK